MKWYWGIGSSQCFIGKKDALPEATHEGYANTFRRFEKNEGGDRSK
jgi:hypothetical protein